MRTGEPHFAARKRTQRTPGGPSGAVARGVFIVGAAALGAALVAASAGLPAFGHFHGRYGVMLNLVAVAQRHVTDVVSAVNFDYRGIDTLGEEFILFAASSGVVLILREVRGNRQAEVTAAGRAPGPPSGAGEPSRSRGGRDGSGGGDAVRGAALLSAPLVLAVGVEVATHGQVDPGGGFQGGALIATAVVMVYLSGEVTRFRRAARPGLSEPLEALGAGAFVVVGLAGVLGAGLFLANLVPLGPVGAIDSGGTIAVLNAVVGLEVAGGLTVTAVEYVEQSLLAGSGGGAQGSEGRDAEGRDGSGGGDAGGSEGDTPGESSP